MYLDNDMSMAIYILEHQGGAILLEGTVALPTQDKEKGFFAEDRHENRYDAELFVINEHPFEKDVTLPDKKIWRFRFCIPTSGLTDLSFWSIAKGQLSKIKFFLGRRVGLNQKLQHSYLSLGDICITTQEDRLIFSKATLTSKMKFAFWLWYELLCKKKRTALFFHIYITFWRLLFPKRKIWLISDRLKTAGDNGEFFFEYVMMHKPKGVKAFFVLTQDSKDHERIQQYGSTVDPFTKKYKLLYLLASQYITAYIDDFVLNPLGVHEEYLNDLIHFKLTYLQHGVIKDDFSQDQTKIRKNINRFVTSASAERKSLLELPYGYSEKEVLLAGLPRFDLITNCSCNKRKKQILFAPTWRTLIEGYQWDFINGTSQYNSQFKETEFYHFYNMLINDPRILNCMNLHEYVGIFQLHPVIRIQAKDFQTNDIISFQAEQKSYLYAIEENAMVVTDYSSIAFDYVYAGKPVIYTQFDLDKFYSLQNYNEGYFDYEHDGFGPVCYDYESTVEAIINAIENDCVLEEKYQDRRKKFFAYFDGNNCKRIYEEILKLDKE